MGALPTHIDFHSNFLTRAEVEGIDAPSCCSDTNYIVLIPCLWALRLTDFDGREDDIFEGQRISTLRILHHSVLRIEVCTASSFRNGYLIHEVVL